jgi:hypothetical protein
MRRLKMKWQQKLISERSELASSQEAAKQLQRQLGESRADAEDAKAKLLGMTMEKEQMERSLELAKVQHEEDIKELREYYEVSASARASRAQRRDSGSGAPLIFIFRASGVGAPEQPPSLALASLRSWEWWGARTTSFSCARFARVYAPLPRTPLPY